MTDELPGAGPELDAIVNTAAGLVTGKPSQMASAALGAIEAWREKQPATEYVIWSPHHDDAPPYKSPWDRLAFCCEIYGPDKLMGQGIALTLAVAICQAIVRASRGGAE